LFGATAAGLLVAVAALTLLTWPVPIEEFGVSIDVLGYVALGGICVALLPVARPDVLREVERYAGTAERWHRI
jgi:hypothetical protein